MKGGARTKWQRKEAPAAPLSCPQTTSSSGIDVSRFENLRGMEWGMMGHMACPHSPLIGKDSDWQQIRPFQSPSHNTHAQSGGCLRKPQKAQPGTWSNFAALKHSLPRSLSFSGEPTEPLASGSADPLGPSAEGGAPSDMMGLRTEQDRTGACREGCPPVRTA